jgi:pimeloyl-[acyl-carrier protein] methyl ester esterase
MTERLILLPGWGLGVAPLQPLKAALDSLAPALEVDIQPLPDLPDATAGDWLDRLDSALPSDCWLGGWSLGGMLASELAARRGNRCRGLLTLASNPRFVATPHWPTAMSRAVFDAFLSGCAQAPAVTLKRFSALCAQGAAAEARSLSRQLLGGAASSELVGGLQVLAQLDTRAALQAYGGRQLHLFAAADALVPVSVAQQLRTLVPRAEVRLVEHASHAFLLENPQGIATMMQAFLGGGANV